MTSSTSTTIPMKDNVTRNTARRPRSAPRPGGQETERDRFEFARRHIIAGDKLSAASHDAFQELHAWLRYGKTSMRDRDRRPRTPEEREELKRLTNAYRDARARQLIHDNDGRNI